MLKPYFYSVFFFLFLAFPHLDAQVLINEVSSASVSTFLDEDGDQEDWIEFYNSSGIPVNMGGYTISTTENGEVKSWTFPSIIIKPFQYLTVFCSGKNRNAYFDHWEVPVYANNPWKYFLGVSDPPPTWRDITFNDASWATGNGGIGYGDGDDSTVIAPVYSVFMRKSFYVADTSKIPTGLLFLDYDDAYVAYLNGVEISRSNIGVYGDHPAFNTLAYDEHEAIAYSTGNFSGAAFVPPQQIDTVLKPGMNVFSLQVHNYSGGLDDLSAIPYFLIGVNDTTVTYFPFAATVNLHTSFHLNSNGQTLTLKNASGAVQDEHIIGNMQLNNTYGRRPDGGSSWYYFDTPTPDTTNNTSPFYTNYLAKPSFDLPAGFYSTPQTAGVSSAGLVRYTLDGSDPSQSSALYTGPISIDSTTVLRARNYSSNPYELPSEIITNTYFINENIDLPVVSLTSDPYNLFDYNYGIYVFGPGADTVNIPFQGSNFWKGWERPANIEYFDPHGDLGFETPSSIAIQGNYSKAWPQRGFTVRTRDNFKGETINYPLFPDKPITQYKSFNIRNAGSDWNTCHMRDRFNQKNAQKSTSLDIMDGRPCVLFINGRYWGVYELREKQDKDYVEANTGVPSGKIDLLEFDGNIIEGSNAGFLNMVSYIAGNDMSVPANYNTVKGMLDIENFCDYFITETFIINVDWLGSYTNNIKFWRPNNPAGKWRYMLWDTDLSLGFANSIVAGASPNTDFLDVAIHPPTANPHSTMLRNLLANTEFKNYFVDRYADLINTVFQPDKMLAGAQELHDEMLPEMARHFNRWNGTWSSSWSGFIGRAGNVAEWENEIDSMLLFSDTRVAYARNQIQGQFSLAKQVDVTLDAVPAGAGKIKISTVTPETLPWSGVYFDGVPVTITAIANPGYEFRYWEANSNLPVNNASASMTLNIDTSDVFKAHFEKLELGMDVYPNPFNDMITINYELPESMQVSLKLYSVIGQEVAQIIFPESFQPEGSNSIQFNAEGLSLAQGLYFLEFRAKDKTTVVKLVRAKGK
jgi:hypothetical protein